ncbi:RidA family protein [Arthrobacter sp. D2-10]
MSSFQAIAPATTGPTVGNRFSPAIIANGFVYTSGQVGKNPETGEFPEDFREEVERTIANLENVLKAAGADLKDVVKTMCFVSDISLFKDFNEVYVERFAEPRPARSTIFNCLEGFRVEIEAIAVLPGATR